MWAVTLEWWYLAPSRELKVELTSVFAGCCSHAARRHNVKVTSRARGMLIPTRASAGCEGLLPRLQEMYFSPSQPHLLSPT